MEWTEEQKKVINLRNRNILVSAAAGSGKTAVLVERIIQMISNKTDIDHLLIVTFTNAAAAEMRERISEAIEKKLIEQPNNNHLQKQQTLIQTAQITTIHSFCLNVIRNNFNTIELDPSFRVAEETELNLLKSDIVSELLEKHYVEKNESFYDFIESYSTGKTDIAIENLILQLYTFSQSYPNPIDWLNNLRTIFEVQVIEDLETLDCIKFLCNYINEIVDELENIVNEAISICEDLDGPYMYLDALMEDKTLINQLKLSNTYKAYSKILFKLKWAKLSSKKDDNISLEKRELVKNLRGQIKDTINNICKNYFFHSVNSYLEDIIDSKIVMNVFIDLVIEFSIIYSENKATKNILDFNDLEHKALEILVKNGDRTFVAKDLSEYYEEILIDEYQDSNLVQETLLNSISKESLGKPNIFMVGDVKQSIYKFRLARPEIFMEKYQTYSTKDSNYQKIDLHKNFRSRKEVIDSVNFIFSKIMDIKLGGIDYDDTASLKLGAEFPDKITSATVNKTEVIVIDLSTDILNEDENFDYTTKEIEAKAIANKIKNIINSEFKVYDKNIGDYRDAKYSDIVILLRTISGWADVFETIFMKEGIPAHCSTSTGYFSTIEIQTILSMLNIVDNPIQDIPLVSVLKSPIVGLSSEELAMIKSEFKTEDMYGCVINYIESGSNQNLKSKLLDFYNLLNKFRNCVPYTNIHDLIWYILEETDYYNYVLAMPAGAKRRANIDMLIERAIQFENTSYKGLFNFVRYIEKVKQYDIDFGEANILGENENVVRIMSIHKSKGLEFPIVFVSGLGKIFNNQDSRNKVVIHSELGIGADYIDYKLRVKSPTLIKKIISKRIVMENLSEELRVLYVALTRAKEKLIMTGTTKYIDKMLTKSFTGKLPFAVLSSANTYFDWILTVLPKDIPFNNKIDSQHFSISIVNLKNLLTEDIKIEQRKNIAKEELLNWNEPKLYDNNILDWRYIHSNEVDLHAKMTVTEIKTLSPVDEYSEHLITLDENITTPKFISGAGNVKGVTRGVAMHKFMQNIEFSKINSIENIKKQIQYLIEVGKLTIDEANLINIKDIYNLITSPLAQRIIKAEVNSKLFREKQFIIGIKANDIDEDFKSNELILIQGTIDIYFEEEENIILLDYKTDKVLDESTLIQRYNTQIKYYTRAIEQITNKKVTEKIIYSFSLNKEILL